MPAVLLAILILALLVWTLHVFTKANPHQVARGLTVAGGSAALAGSAFLTVRGQLGLAIPLGLAGLALLGWLPAGLAPFGLGRRTEKSAGQVSRVRAPFVEMELDHDSGTMNGRILAGRHQGASLDGLDASTLTGLMAEVDGDSRALLAAYLDRRDPGWREHAQGDAAAGHAGPSRSGGPMTQQEAYEILGVAPGASAEEIGRAHRTLMKKLHPDQGGSTYLAARINAAKDVLLRRHR